MPGVTAREPFAHRAAAEVPGCGRCRASKAPTCCTCRRSSAKAADELKTDLATGDLLYLAGLAKEIGPERLKVLTVPGKTELVGGQSFWLPDHEKLADVVRCWMKGTPRAGTRPASGWAAARWGHRSQGRRCVNEIVELNERLDLVLNALDREETIKYVTLDVSPLTQMMDYLVICTGHLQCPHPGAGRRRD